MPYVLEKRLALLAEASNLMLAGSLRTYGRQTNLVLRTRLRNKSKKKLVPPKRAA